MRIDESDDLYEIKKKLFGSPPSSKQFIVDSYFATDDMTKVLAYLRVAVYNEIDDELRHEVKKKVVVSHKFIESISVRNELASIKRLQSACEHKLNEYIHTLEEDLDLMDRHDLSLNKRNAL